MDGRIARARRASGLGPRRPAGAVRAVGDPPGAARPIGRATLLAGLGAAIAALVAAAPAAAGELRDMLGRPLVLAGPPARVVSLAPSLTEVVYALGAEAQLVGVTEFCDYPPDAAQKRRIGGVSTPRVELILALRPDVVLATTEGNREEDIRTLERLGLPVFVVRPHDFATVLASVERVGGLLGRAEAAERLAARMAAEAAAIARRVAGRPRPRVLYVLWGDPLIVPGRDTLLTDLIRRAGGESVTADESLPYPRFALEEALARQPEQVILARHGQRSVDGQLQQWRALTLLPAVRAGRVAAVDGNLLHRPGPRVVQGLRTLARLLHPEVAW